MTNQQLKAHCEDVIANPQDHLDWVVDMARVALASLEAKPLGYIHKHAWRDYKQAVCSGDNDHLSAYANASSHFAVYTVPPLPELKQIELVKDLPCNAKESQDYRVGFAMGCAKYAEGMVKNIRSAGYEVKP